MKSVRPKMTTEARDALNRMTDARIASNPFVETRSDAIVDIEIDVSIIDIVKKHHAEVVRQANWTTGFYKRLAERNEATASNWEKLCLLSTLINCALLAYTAQSQGWFL